MNYNAGIEQKDDKHMKESKFVGNEKIKNDINYDESDCINIMGDDGIAGIAGEIKNNISLVKELIDKIYNEKLEDNEQHELFQCLLGIKDYIEIIEKENEMIIEKSGQTDMRSDISEVNICNNTNRSLGVDFYMKNTRALIVDDNEINNYVVSGMLEKFGIVVDMAKSGDEAIKLYKKNEYDFILMDYLMPPGMNGVETISEIRKIGTRGENQLIIGVTAYNDEEFKKGLNEYDVELILYKPVNMQQMAVILMKELSGKIECE